MPQKLLLSLAAISLLAGCAAGTDPDNPSHIPQIKVEQKPFTPDIERVRASTTPYHPTLTVGQAFDQYQFCEKPSRLWEELESGSVEFSCRLTSGGIFQTYWRVDAEGVRLSSVTVTTMADAEFAGIDLRRDDAQEVLRRVMTNRQEPLD